MSFFKNLHEILSCGDKEGKIAKFKKFYSEYKNGAFDIADDGEIRPLISPSYASFCTVTEMKNLNKKAKKQNKESSFLHSIAHIEYSAIDIALDAAYRFRNLPKEFYDDWLEVADDEVRHFEVHNGLFIALQITADSLLHRMAVLPRYMEANGLDANAFMLKKLEKEPDKSDLREILQAILDEEISHVSKGDRWFKFECARLGVDPQEYVAIVQKFYPNSFMQTRELNVEARLKSGFSEAEIAMIQDIAKSRAVR